MREFWPTSINSGGNAGIGQFSDHEHCIGLAEVVYGKIQSLVITSGGQTLAAPSAVDDVIFD